MIIREMTEKLIEKIQYDKIVILKGARQTGKTTILKEIQNLFDKQGEKTFYIAADMDFENRIFKTKDHFLTYIDSKVDWTDKLYVFIDEFQYIQHAGRFLKVLFDSRQDLNIIVSGSSSLEITKNSEFLTGRKITAQLRRISFCEYLKHKNRGLFNQLMEADLKNWQIIYEVHQNSLELLYGQYVAFGAYPEILTAKGTTKKTDLLNELIGTYLQKDVAGFLNVKNTSAFNNLVKVLINESGRLMNKASLSNTIGISQNTMNHYLDILEGTYIFEFLPPFFTNIRKEVSKMKKIILQDMGFKVAFNNNKVDGFDDLNGQEAETCAALAIRNALPDSKLYHYRTISKSEIDFILKIKEKYMPIEVKFRNKVKTPIVLKNFIKKYDCIKPVVITKHFLAETNNARFIPLPLVECFFNKIDSNNINHAF